MTVRVYKVGGSVVRVTVADLPDSVRVYKVGASVIRAPAGAPPPSPARTVVVVCGG